MLLVILYSLAVAILSVILVCDPDVIFHLHLAFAFAVSTTAFAPLDRTHVLLQVRALQRYADRKWLIVAELYLQKDMYSVTASCHR
jgi:hypothetical protein